MRPNLLHAALIATLPCVAVPVAEAARPDPTGPFDIAEIHVEKNATDDDTEIVIEAVGGDDGLCQFRVYAPDGRPIVHFNSVDRSTGGQREFVIESPEPPGDAILAGYPEGLYRFRGRTCEGERFDSADPLSHDLPAAVVITSPAADSEVDASNGIVIEWSPVPGVAEFILELENESADPEQSLSLNLPAETTHLEDPGELDREWRGVPGWRGHRSAEWQRRVCRDPVHDCRVTPEGCECRNGPRRAPSVSRSLRSVRRRPRAWQHQADLRERTASSTPQPWRRACRALSGFFLHTLLEVSEGYSAT